jgi:hypothetical protein
MPIVPLTRPSGPLYGPEPELTVATFGPINGVMIGDGCRVGVYSWEERQKRIERFREKKLKRIWRKQIKYDCRKRLADTRPRVKGRFVSRAGDGEGDENAPASAAANPVNPAANPSVPSAETMMLLNMSLPGKAVAMPDGGLGYIHTHTHSFGDTTEEDTGADSECSSSVPDPNAYPYLCDKDGVQTRPRRDSLACIMDLIDQNG